MRGEGGGRQITLAIPKRAKGDGPAAGAVVEAAAELDPHQGNVGHDGRRDARDQQEDGGDEEEEGADVVDEARHGWVGGIHKLVWVEFRGVKLG